MPVRMRLAAKGAARKLQDVEVHAVTRAPVGLDGGHQQLDVVVEELDVVGDLLLAAHRGRQHHHLGAGLPRDGVRRLEVEVGLDQEDLDALPLHLLDEVDGVAGRRRDAGPRLHVADHVQAEAVAEVRPGAVVGHDLESPCRAPSSRPSASRPRPAACRSPRSAGRSRRRPPGRSAASFCLDGLGDAPAVVGIEPVVRVARRVHVAHGARDLARSGSPGCARSARRRGSRPSPAGSSRCGSG